MLGYAKAIVSGLIAGLSTLATGLADGALTAQEIIYAAIAFLLGLGIVYAVPNKPPS